MSRIQKITNNLHNRVTLICEWELKTKDDISPQTYNRLLYACAGCTLVTRLSRDLSVAFRPSEREYVAKTESPCDFIANHNKQDIMPWHGHQQPPPGAWPSSPRGPQLRQDARGSLLIYLHWLLTELAVGIHSLKCRNVFCFQVCRLLQVSMLVHGK